MNESRFRDRADAGAVLATRLTGYAGSDRVVVLGLARGGVPVAAPIARALRAALDVFVVRKLGLPGHEELAMGAVASGGATVRNDDVIAQFGVPADVFDAVRDRELEEVARREQAYRNGRPPVPVEEKKVVVVDDGLATGASMRAAVVALRAQRPAGIVIAVPVAAASTCNAFARKVDDVICAYTPAEFHAVGAHYDDFTPTSDDEVRQTLAAAEH